MARSTSRRKGRRDGRVPRGVVIAIVVVVLIAASVVGAKFYADSSAESQMSARTEEVSELLEGSSPRDFLAFNSGRSVPGSVARDVAEQSDFVSVNAEADQAVIRFQPKGWWAGFTERCLVAVVDESGARVTAPKTACVRVDPDGY